MDEITRLFGKLSPDSLRTLLAAARVDAAPRPVVEPRMLGELRARGWSAAALGIDTAPLAGAIDVLHAEGLPLAAAYILPVVWEVGLALRDAISKAIGQPYALAEDFWAFRVAPGRHGWAPHRGSVTLLDRRAPESINVWVALTDVSVDGSSMHFVPLDEDEGFCARKLELVATGHAQAVPVGAGTALFWNANVLHWGGACVAHEARRSISFTLTRHDAVNDARTVESAGEDEWGRLEAVARQIATYGFMDEATTDEHRRWARLMLGMSAAKDITRER